MRGAGDGPAPGGKAKARARMRAKATGTRQFAGVMVTVECAMWVRMRGS